jgi:hypothetical protein
LSGGTGTSATLNVTAWNLSSSPALITNAGSGYVEQPTVTFSGGGGSGAAAYAVVGTNTTIKSLGNSLAFSVPEGSGFVVSGSNSAGGAFWQAFAASGGPILRATSSTSGQIQTGSAVPIQFTTNASGAGAEQFRVAHTASAVNYVQVTGAATGNDPVISAQGSDADRNLKLTAKGTGAVQTTTRLEVNSSLANYWRMAGANAGAAPVLSVIGTDPNIDITLTPKGTGNVRFGTYTGTILTPTGFIEIKDSGGTVRRLLVG